MRLLRTLRAAVAATVTAAAAVSLTAFGAGPAQAATPLPAHVFAPYFEAWTGDSPAALSAQSGAKHLTMAFLQTATSGSCTAYWNGDTGMPIAQSTFGADIKTIQGRGGDVIPSFGGYTADTTNTEIADSCTDVNQIAEVYKKVITTYDISRLDMDIEVDALDKTAGIDRRNKAIKLVQDWAAANGRKIEISYTLPTTTHGLAENSVALLRNAVSNGTRVDVVNLMTFDYYDNATHNMADDTETAAQGLYNTLAQLYPGKTPTQLWGMIGVTEMPGIDDFGAAETFTLANAKQVYNWAVSKGINTLSFWALQRDRGNCGASSDSCSGIPGNQWDFSHVFAPFTSGTTTPTDDFAVQTTPASGTVAAGNSTTSTVNTSVTAGSAQTVNLTVSGAPTGVSVSLSPTSVTAGGSSTLAITTTTAAVSGTYTLTVTGVGTSVSHSASYTLTITGGNGHQCTAPPWASGTVYTGGQQVSYQGHTWKAKWWTTGETPGTTGQWGVWQDLGAC
ncbi:chitinase [Embleya hyalina]|uniref:chitinase n=1 Tax=Embleya hyalina TaxID=516124 RepID=A0A401YM02_9ACTN|nr:chitinase [Embleya hyalina]GCD95643.1 chitinase [Embleya hyalina]